MITKTLRRRVFALVGRITRSARRLTLHLPRRWPWETQFSRALARCCKPFRSRPDGQPATDPTSPQSRATPVARVPCCVSSRHPAHRNSRIGPYGPCAATGRPSSGLPSTPRPQAISPVAPSPTPFRCPHAVHRCPSVDSGLGISAVHIDPSNCQGLSWQLP